MAEEIVDVGLNNLGVSFTPEQEIEALRVSLTYFVMFLNANGFGIARYPATAEEQVLFLQQPEAAIEDFAINFNQYADQLDQFAQSQSSSEQDIVDQIMKMLAAAGQEISEEILKLLL